jgi:O-antigen/teichoic acid export membrane protein
VAHCNERQDWEHRNRVVTTSFALLGALAVFALLGVTAVAVFLGHFFRQVPVSLLPGMRMALLLVGGSLALGLPASVFNAIFIGLQRNEIPAAVIAARSLGTAALLVWVVAHGGSFVTMAMALSAVNLLSYVAQYALYKFLAGGGQIRRSGLSRDAAWEIVDYCKSLTVWSFAMLLVNGLDLVLVGLFQFSAVPYFAVASTLVTFIAGIQNAIFTAMIPATAVLHARSDAQALGRMIITATRYGMFILLLSGFPLLFAPLPILTFWVGSSYAVHSAVMLQVLVVANVIRLSATPYVVTLIGTGEQRKIILPPLLEGMANLVVSLAAGYMWGALGVAIGTLAGSFVSVAGHWFYNMPRTTTARFDREVYFRDTLLRPILCFLPLVLFGVIANLRLANGHLAKAVLLVLTIGFTMLLTWHLGLMSSERQKLIPRKA